MKINLEHLVHPLASDASPTRALAWLEFNYNQF
jgi:hypothetical protein